ncbi:glycosyltransferase [Pseudomonas sp. LFM046]|uniref:glycosyltransferase n=1 Tax=Pseudomonas sp. LFM046 TaxID=1608357 RepID=UPI0005CFE788|nr:glycosyltransferase [Pseudomonas sp. LFM046]
MPAYKAMYLEEALESIQRQTYRPLELVVCDDCRSDDVQAVVEAFGARANFPVIYRRNETRLWETRSAARAISLASGEYVKFLHDDDRLHPDCIQSLVAVMRDDPGVTLASSRRRRIDEDSNPLPDTVATAHPFSEDVVVNGEQLVTFFADYTINFIGEPSTVLCRRADLLEFGDGLSVLNGKRITWVADLALYVKLLRRGHLAMLAQPLTDFRVSREQYSQIGRDRPGVGEQGHVDFRQGIRELGWYRTEGVSRKVEVAPITRLKTRVFRSMDLLSALGRASGNGGMALSAWLEERVPSAPQMSLIGERLNVADGGPRIAILVVDRLGDVEGVGRTLSSLEAVNLYRNYSVQVLSTAPAALAGRAGEALTAEPEAQVAALNRAVERAAAQWVQVVEAGVEYTTSGLLIAALDLIGADSCTAVYADGVMRGEDGELGVALRPDFNLDLFLSFPASMTRHWLLRRDNFLAMGGFDAQVAEAFELDFLLRLIEQQGLGGIGHISEPLLVSSAFRLEDNSQERAVIERHLRARGYTEPRVQSRLPGRYELDYGHAQPGVVSILVPVKDQLVCIQRCLETLLENTTYPHYEILLINLGSTDPHTCEWLAAIGGMGEDRLRVLDYPAGVSREAACNQAALQARGDLLLWLGAGAGIVDRDWLQQLLNHGLRPEVGAVGAKLLSADGRIRHAGLLLGLRGPSGRAFEGMTHDGSGYLQRLQVEQNYSALSGECLMLRRDLFLELGGFEEDPAFAPWSDVDLCLRIRQAGYLNVWTPRAQLLMEPQPQARASHAEEDAMYARWLPILARDPAYNPGLSLLAEQGFRLADPNLAWRPLQSWRPLPRVLAHPGDLYGCGHYRVIQPFKALESSGLIEGAMSTSLLPVVDLERYEPDVILLQRQIGDERLEAMRRMQSFSSAFKVYELDDYLPNLPMKNAHRQHMPKDVLRSLRRGFGLVDRFVVSTEPLAEAFAGMHEQIRVVRNRLPTHWWGGLESQRRVSARPRVGWAGGAGHSGDLEMIVDVVKELANEVDWVFFGMCPEAIRPYVKEVHVGVEINQYPQALASLNLDLALAPVEQNLFNECKSNLRLLEYGACGFPVICSDVLCYQDGLPVTRVKNRFKDWVDAIRMHINDLDASARAGDVLREAVHTGWMLEGENLAEWYRAWMPD